MIDCCPATMLPVTDNHFIQVAPAAGAILTSVFGTNFDFWQCVPGASDWFALGEKSSSAHEEQIATALAQLTDCRPGAADSSVVVEQQEDGRLLVALALNSTGEYRLAATAMLEDSPSGLTRKLAALFLRDFRLQRELDQLHEDLDVCASQIGTDYEELALLRRLAEYLDMSEVSSGTWHVARMVLPLLANVIQAESLVFVTACQESKDNKEKSEAGVDRPLIWVGPVRMNDEACRNFIDKYRSAIQGQPLVNNHVETDSGTHEFPGVRKFVIVPVARGERLFGWLVAINHAHQNDPAGTSPLWELSQFEFGTVEAGVLSSVACMLATHAHNVELFREREHLLIGIVRAMVSAIDAKDTYTCGHSERVALVSRYLGGKLGLAEEDCKNLYLAGLLHDLGKLAVPDAVLGKPGRLGDEELAQIRPHPETGWAILQDLDQLQHLVPAVLHHHEQYDGSGYPDGLAGEAIPLSARILAVADAYDAMVSNRPYRHGMPHENVETIFRDGAGKQWDPRVIEAFFRNMPEILDLWNSHRPQMPRRRPRPTRGTQ